MNNDNKNFSHLPPQGEKILAQIKKYSIDYSLVFSDIISYEESTKSVKAEIK